MTPASAEPEPPVLRAGQPGLEAGQPAPQAGLQAPPPVAAPAAAFSRVLLLRGVLALVLALGAAVGAVLLYRHGVQQWLFGPVAPETTNKTEVPRYIGPWMVAAAGVLLVAGLLLISAGSDGYRLVASRRAVARPGNATG